MCSLLSSSSSVTSWVCPSEENVAKRIAINSMKKSKKVVMRLIPSAQS